MKVRNIYKFMLAVFIASLLMSPVGWMAVLNIGGNYFPEIAVAVLLLVAPLFFEQECSEIIRVLSGRSFLITFAVVTFLLLLGFVLHGDFVAAYSDYRSLVLMVISYFVVLNYRGQRDVENFILLLFVFCLAFYVFAFYAVANYLESATKYAFAWPAFIGAVYLAIKNEKTATLIITMALGSILSVVGLVRQYLFLGVVLDSIGVIYIISLLLRRKIAYKNILSLSLLFVVAAASFDKIYHMVYKFIFLNPIRYGQTIGKMLQLYNSFFYNTNLGSSERRRIQYMNFISDNFEYFLFPSGLGQKVTLMKWRSLWMPEQEYMIGGAADGGHLFVAAQFGLIIGFVLFAIVMFSMLSAIDYKNKTDMCFRLICILLTMIVFVSANPLSILGMAISFSMVLALFSRCPETDARRCG